MHGPSKATAKKNTAHAISSRNHKLSCHAMVVNVLSKHFFSKPVVSKDPDVVVVDGLLPENHESVNLI